MEQGASLKGFIEAAGRSLGEAQQQLIGEEQPAGEAMMAVSEVEIEVKATLDGTGDEMKLLPVSRKDASSGAMAHEALSTLRVRYVALPGEAPSPPQAELEHDPRGARELDRE